MKTGGREKGADPFRGLWYVARGYLLHFSVSMFSGVADSASVGIDSRKDGEAQALEDFCWGRENIGCGGVE